MSTLDELREVGLQQWSTTDGTTWVAVCRLADLVPERGAAALVAGEQVALFRLVDGTVHAVGNLDPFSGAQVMARGIVGTRDGAPMVAGPLYKQHFDLRSGRCLEEPGTRIPVRAVRVVDGTVLIGVDELDAEAVGADGPVGDG